MSLFEFGFINLPCKEIHQMLLAFRRQLKCLARYPPLPSRHLVIRKYVICKFKTFTQSTPKRNDKNNLPFFEVANPTRKNKPTTYSPYKNKSGQQ
jgi:hypothetical protein